MAQCDEIKVDYRDYQSLENYINNEELKDKTFIVNIPKDVKNIDWNFLMNIAKQLNIIVGCADIQHGLDARNQGFKWYWTYAINSWTDVHGMVALKPSYLMITAPLSMSLEQMKRITEIPLRMAPNIAYDAYIPRADGIKGQWVRPEDAEAYGQYISTFEFLDADLKKEQALFRVYHDQKEWPGNLNLLISNLGFDIDNRVIQEETIKARMNCGQRCMSGGRCHICEADFRLAEAARKYYNDLHAAKKE